MSWLNDLKRSDYPEAHDTAPTDDAPTAYSNDPRPLFDQRCESYMAQHDPARYAATIRRNLAWWQQQLRDDKAAGRHKAIPFDGAMVRYYDMAVNAIGG